MRTFRNVLYVLGTILTLLLVVGFIAPKDITQRTSIYIDTPKNLIFEEVSILKNMLSWSPHVEGDTGAIFTFEGTPGTIGSKVSWKGNRKVGTADQYISEIEALRRVTTDIWYTRPFQCKHQFDFYLEDEENGTRVTWKTTNRIPFPFNLKHIFRRPEHAMQGQMTKGLDALRIRCEATMQQEVYKGFDIYRGYALEKQYRVRRAVRPFKNKVAFMDTVFTNFDSLSTWKDSFQVGVPIVIYHSIDLRDSLYDLSVGYEVYRDSMPTGEFNMVMDSVDVWNVDLTVEGSTLDDAYEALRNFIRYNGLKQESMFAETLAINDSTGMVMIDSILNLSYLIQADL